MPSIDDYRQWIEETKKLIGFGNQNKYVAHNDKVAGLLKDLEDLGYSDPVLVKEYESLALRATNATKKSEVKKVDAELEGLGKRAQVLKDKIINYDATREKLILESVKKIEAAKKQIADVAKPALVKLGKGSLSIDHMYEDINDAFTDYGRTLKAMTPPKDMATATGTLDQTLKQAVKYQLEFIKSRRFLDHTESKNEEEIERKRNAEQLQINLELKGLKEKALARLVLLEDVGVPANTIQAITNEINSATNKTMVATADGKITTARQNQIQLQTTAVNGVQLQVTEVKKQIELKKKEFKKSKPATATLESLSKELDGIEQLLLTNNPEAIKGAEMTCKRVARLVNGTDDESGFGAFFTRIADHETTLKESKLKKYQAASCNQLLVKLAKLRDEFDAFELTAAEKELAEIDYEIKNLVTGEEELVVWREGIEQWLKTTKGAAGKIEDFLKSPSIFTKIGDKIKGKTSMIDILTAEIKNTYDVPGADTVSINAKQATAQNRIEEILKAIELKGDNSGAIAKLDKEFSDGAAELQRQADEEAEEDKDLENWKNELKVFKADLKEVKKSVKSAKGSTSDLEAVEMIGKTAEKVGKTDREGGRAQLKQAKNRLQRLSENPEGVSFKSPKELGKAPDNWRRALEGFNNNLTILAKEAGEKAPFAGIEAIEIKKKVMNAQTVFDAGAFARAGELIDTEVSLVERKKIREEVLRDVRRQKALLLNDPTIALIRRSPFGPKGIARDVRAFLDSIELNALRAVPAE